ncbi:hypothetical protein F1880_001625 [Penicillium rolfsii]|nr:hypothetical protein F1880_001625 [Penicillium rolfsii]
MDDRHNALRKKPRSDRKHACTFCNKKFTRRDHCARHKRGRQLPLITHGKGHSTAATVPSASVDREFTLDVLARHEKDVHKQLYSPRSMPSGHAVDEKFPAKSSESFDKPQRASPVSLVHLSSDDRAPPSPQLTERPALYPSSPNARVQEAIAALDFTTLHAEALSTNHMKFLQARSPSLHFDSIPRDLGSGPYTPCSEKLSPSPLIESPSQMSEDSGYISTAHVPNAPQGQSTTRKQKRDIFTEPDLPLLFGPIFDPLWNPVITKTAAISGYVTDLHRGMLIKAGILRNRPGL